MRGDDLPIDSQPWIKVWAPPELPAGVHLGTADRYSVDVRFIVDAAGRVASAHIRGSAQAPWDSAALASVKAWVFTPALDNGHAVPACLDGTVVFKAGGRDAAHRLIPPVNEQPHLSPAEPASITRDPDAIYPDELMARNLAGRVVFSLHLDAAGKIQALAIRSASHAAFVQPAIAALRTWTFAPAKQGDLAVADDLDGAVDFEPNQATPTETLAANGITGPDGAPPAIAPGIVEARDPVYPYAAQFKGERGDAVVAFSVDRRGSTTAISVVSASAPEFGQALAAAVAIWAFNPSDRAAAVPLRVNWPFGPPAVDSRAGPEVGAAVVQAERAHQIGNAAGLDRPLRPIYRISPSRPASEVGPGQAVLDAVICRDGRVRLVRIVSSTQPDLGWAAATALAQWVFDPPQRGGRPVDVRVRVPFRFSAH